MKKIKQQSLILNIDAQSPEDMVMMLRQALYEINKQLPPAPDAPLEERNRRVAEEWAAQEDKSSAVVTGHSKGSLGEYYFEFHRHSKEFTKLEAELFEQGYSRGSGNTNWISGEAHTYCHPNLPGKSIGGSPLTIRETK